MMKSVNLWQIEIFYAPQPLFKSSIFKPHKDQPCANILKFSHFPSDDRHRDTMLIIVMR